MGDPAGMRQAPHIRSEGHVSWIGDVVARTVVRSLTRKAMGKAAKSPGSLTGKRGKKKGGGRKKGPAKSKKEA